MIFTIFLCVEVSKTLLSICRRYITRTLKIHWRESLTRHMMDNWLDNAAHMHVIGANGGANGKVENPDQRIADDCDSYVWRQVDVIVSFVESTVELYFFLPLLYKLSPPIYPVEGWLCYASVGYCLVYTGMVAF